MSSNLTRSAGLLQVAYLIVMESPPLPESLAGKLAVLVLEVASIFAAPMLAAGVWWLFH